MDVQLLVATKPTAAAAANTWHKKTEQLKLAPRVPATNYCTYFTCQEQQPPQPAIKAANIAMPQHSQTILPNQNDDHR